MKTKVGIVGASGYSGAVLAGLLASHPEVELVFATSDKKRGERVEDHVRARVGDLCFSANAEGAARAGEVDVVFLATSAEVSADLAPKILPRARVIDLSGAFRLAGADDYTRWYKLAHPSLELLASAHFGLPEVTGAPPAGTRLVANPGCYATSAIVPLAPLVREGLVDARTVVIDAKSGVTGAGRQAKEDYSFSEVAEDLRAYKLLSHQHTPEIERFTGAKVTFTAHLLPIRRGILATIYARPTGKGSIEACLRDTYAKAPFVTIRKPEAVRIADVAFTNRIDLGVAASDDVVVIVAAIDNLVKGAAGQAVQNLNLLSGWDEGLGLLGLARG